MKLAIFLSQHSGLSPFPGNSTYIPDVRSVSVFKAANKTYLAVANYDLESRSGFNMFKIEFVRNETESTAQTIPDMIKSLLVRMKDELNMVCFFHYVVP